MESASACATMERRKKMRYIRTESNAKLTRTFQHVDRRIFDSEKTYQRRLFVPECLDRCKIFKRKKTCISMDIWWWIFKRRKRSTNLRRRSNGEERSCVCKHQLSCRHIWILCA